MAENEKTASSLKTLVIVVGVIFAFSSVMLGFYAVSGKAKLSSLPENVYKVSLTEYEISTDPEPIIARVGEPVILQISNDGSVHHEFMIVRDISMMASMTEMMARQLLQQGFSEEEVEKELEEFDEQMRERMMEMYRGIIEGELMVELDAGEKTTITLTFYEPGIYNVGCFKLEGTFPRTHAHEGMFNQIIVIEG